MLKAPLLLLAALIWPSGMASTYKIYATSSHNSTVASLLFTPPDHFVLIDETKVGQKPGWITFDEESNGAFVLGADISYYSLKSAPKVHEVECSIQDDGQHDEFVSGCIAKKCLIVANYSDGSVNVRPVLHGQVSSRIAPVEKTFRFHRVGVGIVTSRQDKSYAHDTIASPDGEWLYICDLGADKIHHLRYKGDHCNDISAQGETQVHQGSGPRHLRFYKDNIKGKQFAYLASELSTTLTAFLQNSQSGMLTMIGEPLLTVPQGVALGGTLADGPIRTTAEVAISSDGKFVYVSNRGDEVEDHITVFKREQDGSVKFLEWFPTGGIKPRHFSISHDGEYLSVAHETSGSVVILKRDMINGSLSKISNAIFEHLPGTQFAGFHPTQ